MLGGGIIGCSIAYNLARRGTKVILMEKSLIGCESSGCNSGGVRQQNRDSRELPLAMESVKLWENLESELDFDVEYTQGGNIMPFINEDELDFARGTCQKELEAGLEVEIWNRSDLRKRAPYIRDVFIGAKYCASDGNANPLLATRAFGWAAKKEGVTILSNTKAESIEIHDGRVISVTGVDKKGEIVIVEAPIVIHACGAWTPLLSETIGLKVPVQPLRHVILVTQRMTPFFTEYIHAELYGEMAKPALTSSINQKEQIGIGIRPARQGHVHIGGISTPDTFDQSAPADAIEYLARGAAIMMPALRDASILRAWSRQLEYTPDRLPIIGGVDGIAGYFLAAGFSGHGFCLGPIIGKLVTELILDGEASMPLHDFRFSRFQENGGISIDERRLVRA